MENSFTKIVKKISDSLAEAKQKNLLIEEARKTVNPTFFEILEELEKDDKTLYSMLILWYSEKYLENPLDLDKILDKVIGEQKKTFVPKKTRPDYFGGSCGSLVTGGC